MSVEVTIPFAAALKAYRLNAGLTQEALAERAAVSPRTIQALERGENTPHRDTAERLATALSLDGAARAQFVAAATPVPRRRRPDSDPATPPALALWPNGLLTFLPADRAGRLPQHNLPAALSGLIGREREQGEVRALLGRARLVTLMGTGGVGKTRLALAVAGELVDAYADGVWLVELAALADPAAVPRAVAATFGLREDAGRPVVATLLDALRERHLLLVLDNCEHLIAACAALTDTLLQACPRLQMLATSREALNIAGETAWRVPSLSLPAAPAPPLETLAQSAAVRLFVERAAAAHPHFALTEQNAPAVAHICRRLDGIPLALELAAARVPALGVEQLAGRLDHCFGVLIAGRRTALPRQQTLWATVDWSYALLRPPEQALFARLSVFAGGFTLEATEAVGAGGAVAPQEVLNLLARLVEQSLVLAEDGGAGGVRYRLLETLRQYGHERLEAGDDAATVRGRHAAYYLALAEAGAVGLQGSDQMAWYARLEVEHENLRSAIHWLAAQGSSKPALRLAGALVLFWEWRGWRRQGLDLLATALAVPGASCTAARAEALCGAGILAHHDDDDGAAQTWLEEGLAMGRELGDQRCIGAALFGLGWLALDQGNCAAARALLIEGLEARRGAGDPWGSAYALSLLASATLSAGDAGAARTLSEEALALRRAMGDRQGLAFTLGGVADAYRAQGDLARARALLQESLDIQRTVGDRPGTRWSLYALGVIAVEQGDAGPAGVYFAEALYLTRELGDRRSVVSLLHGVAGRAVAMGHSSDAVCLAGAAADLGARLGFSPSPDDQAAWDRDVALARRALGDEEAAAVWARGQAMTLEQAAAEALRSATAQAR